MQIANSVEMAPNIQVKALNRAQKLLYATNSEIGNLEIQCKDLQIVASIDLLKMEPQFYTFYQNGEI